MAKGKNRRKQQAAKKKRRKSMKGGGDSNYARKRAYCINHGVWGFQVPEPKPWRRKQ